MIDTIVESGDLPQVADAASEPVNEEPEDVGKLGLLPKEVLERCFEQFVPEDDCSAHYVHWADRSGYLPAADALNNGILTSMDEAVNK
eukprot:3536867-Prymnesium_polylepis.2